jgi:hypothetical protein
VAVHGWLLDALLAPLARCPIKAAASWTTLTGQVTGQQRAGAEGCSGRHEQVAAQGGLLVGSACCLSAHAPLLSPTPPSPHSQWSPPTQGSPPTLPMLPPPRPQTAFHIRFGLVHVGLDTLRRCYKAFSLWLANQFGSSNARPPPTQWRPPRALRSAAGGGAPSHAELHWGLQGEGVELSGGAAQGWNSQPTWSSEVERCTKVAQTWDKAGHEGSRSGCKQHTAADTICFACSNCLNPKHFTRKIATVIIKLCAGV